MAFTVSATGLVNVGDHHGGALAGKGEGDGSSDSLGGAAASYDNYLIFEV